VSLRVRCSSGRNRSASRNVSKTTEGRPTGKVPRWLSSTWSSATPGARCFGMSASRSRLGSSSDICGLFAFSVSAKVQRSAPAAVDLIPARMTSQTDRCRPVSADTA
jgi:hypothetical protein